jgi:hypothetical protein
VEEVDKTKNLLRASNGII